MKCSFNEVSVKGIRKWIDADGKKRQETKKFFQTLSPFNKNIDGSIKTREQIIAEITERRDKWVERVK